MPSFFTASANWAMLILFCWARLASTSLSSRSSTRMPASVARWVCTRVRIRRSSTWVRRTASGGGVMWRSASCFLPVSSARSSSLCSTTPSLTTATMRSSGSACAAEAARTRAREGSRSRRMGRFGSSGVPILAALVGGGQQRLEAGADAGQALELQLEVDPAGVILVGVELVAPVGTAERPAAGLVLQAAHPLERAVVLARVAPAAQQRQRPEQRRGRAEVHLLERHA